MPQYANKLAIGTVQFGLDYGIANRYGRVNVYEISVILDMAWENGVDTLDTAKAYGASEELIGTYLKQRPEWTWNIITKLSDGENDIVAQIQDSIDKLTILPSVVLAHSAELFMADEFQKRLANKAGVSIYTEDEINQVMQSTLKPDVIQLPMNMLDTRLYRRGILEHLNEKGIEIHVRSAFLQGLFYLPESELINRFSDVVPFLEQLKSIAAGAGLTLSELSLMWLVKIEEVSKVVIGVDGAAQLKTHLETLKKKVDSAVFDEALVLQYENEQILNPSLWD